MVNILHNTPNIDEDWCFDAYRKHIRPESRVVVVAFSFGGNSVKNQEDWLSCYGSENGKYYGGMVGPFKRYGIDESNITWVNYFEDSPLEAKKKITDADILYFPGGLPDRMMDRIVEKQLVEVIRKHQGGVMGFSAGALIQLGEYHLTPDDDYDAFSYYKGLHILENFYIEVHFEQTPEQMKSIQKVLDEKTDLVYGIGDQGAIVIENDEIEVVGDVTLYANK